MHADGRLGPDVDHVVHVPGTERPDLASRQRPAAGPDLPGRDHPLAQFSLRYRERARSPTVVMEAGALTR